MQKSNYIFIGIAALFAILFFWRSCAPEGKETITKIDTLWLAPTDKPHNITPAQAPAPVEIHNHYEGQGPAPTDTAAIRAILHEFFTELVYKDTIRNDSLDIYLHEKAFKNHITRQYVGYKWKAKERVIKETTTNIVHKNDFYFGIGSMFNTKQLDNLTGEILIETKHWAIGGGGGWDFRFKDPLFKVSLYRKIDFKRKK